MAKKIIRELSPRELAVLSQLLDESRRTRAALQAAINVVLADYPGCLVDFDDNAIVENLTDEQPDA
jgi:hypothetical protein